MVKFYISIFNQSTQYTTQHTHSYSVNTQTFTSRLYPFHCFCFLFSIAHLISFVSLANCSLGISRCFLLQSSNWSRGIWFQQPVSPWPFNTKLCAPIKMNHQGPPSPPPRAMPAPTAVIPASLPLIAEYRKEHAC